MQLYYIQGSPFARMARVLIREYQLPCDEVMHEEFPPPPDYFQVNPLGQVPALEDGNRTYFPTRLVLKRLAAKASGAAAPRPGVVQQLFRPEFDDHDDQLLTVLLAMGDMMVSVQYQKWAGLSAAAGNKLGYEPLQRNQDRVYRALDWAESQVTASGFWPDATSIQDVILACLILWTESRGPIAWRGRPKLEAMVKRLETRPSFIATAPIALA